MKQLVASVILLSTTVLLLQCRAVFVVLLDFEKGEGIILDNSGKNMIGVRGVGQ